MAKKRKKSQSDRFFNPGDDDNIVVVMHVDMKLCFDIMAPSDKNPRHVIENAISYLQTLLATHADTPEMREELVEAASLKIEEIDRYDMDSGARPAPLLLLAREAQ